LRPAANVVLSRELVQLLPVAVLERAARSTAALPPARRLLAELTSRGLRQVCDRALLRRRGLRLLDVPLRRLLLLSRCHVPLLTSSIPVGLPGVGGSGRP